MKNYDKDILRNIVKNIAKEIDFSDDIRVIFERGSGKLDGFMGEILAIDIMDQKTTNELHLIAKVSLKDEKCRNYSVIVESFKNEIIAYKELFPTIQQLRSQVNIPELMQPLVKFYYASQAENEEILIMENIKSSGYKMLPVRELLDDEQVKLVFKHYAGLHANAFALKALRPQEFEQIACKNVNVFVAMLDKKIGKNFENHLHSIRDVLKEMGYEHNLLDNYAENSIGILRKSLDFSGEKYVCFAHVDSWSNNMMFRYEVKNGQQKLSDVKILDWQGWTVGPPVIDLMFCLFSSGSKDVLHNFSGYLKMYHENLSTALASFNLDAEEIYPFQVMKIQMEKYYHFPAMFGIMIRKIRSFHDDHKVDPLNYSADDDATFFDAILTAEFDKNYFLENVKLVCDQVDYMTRK